MRDETFASEVNLLRGHQIHKICWNQEARAINGAQTLSLTLKVLEFG